jgi:hypothetical protein
LIGIQTTDVDMIDWSTYHSQHRHWRYFPFSVQDTVRERRRQAAGVTPVTRAKVRVKWL